MVGGGLHAQPLSLYLPSRTKLWCKLKLRGQVHYSPISTLPLNVLCEYKHCFEYVVSIMLRKVNNSLLQSSLILGLYQDSTLFPYKRNISNLTQCARSMVFILEPGEKQFLMGVGHEIIPDLHMKKRTRATMQSRMIMTAIPMKTVEALHKQKYK